MNQVEKNSEVFGAKINVARFEECDLRCVGYRPIRLRDFRLDARTSRFTMP